MGSAQFPLRNDKSLIVASLRPSFPEHDRKSLTGSGAKRTGLKFGLTNSPGLLTKSSSRRRITSATRKVRLRLSKPDEIGSAHVKFQSLMRISYAGFCL